MPATYTLWRSIDPKFRFPSPIAVGLTGTSFSDTSALGGVTYYYQVMQTDVGSAETSNQAQATFPIPPPTTYPKDAMTRIFSTGTLFVDTGAGPIEFATLQEIEYSVPYQEKELRAAPWINMFAEARAFYGGKMELKATYATILASGLAACTGGQNTLPTLANPAAQPPVAAAPGVMSVGTHAILPKFSAVFTTQDEAGNPVLVTCGNVRTPGLTLPFKREDYVMPNVSMIADEDANGTVATLKFAV